MMIDLFIKCLAIIICSLYIYTKLLNLKIGDWRQSALLVFFGLCLSFVICLIKLYFPYISILTMIVISFIFITWRTKTQIELSITTTVLSFGICYATFIISSILTSGIIYLFGVRGPISRTYLAICASLVLFLLIRIPFRFKRLKNGMPYLIKKGGGNSGVFISVIILNSGIILSNDEDLRLIYVVPIVLSLFGAVMIHLWWRGRLTKEYIENLRSYEMQRLQNALLEKEDQIRFLEQHNEALAKIIHRDNKLIPAMEFAVRDFIQTAGQMDHCKLEDHGQMLLNRLETMSSDRTRIIGEYQSRSKILPKTNVYSVDALVAYMYNKAREHEIKFDLTIFGSAKYMMEKIISESDFNTILADLCENAIIATKGSDSKNILICIGISEGNYSIDVFDSGICFETDTLIHLGLKKITTHADTGGSGIGLTTTFDTIRTYSASFIIEEYNDADRIFTKKVSVKFDNLNQYLVKTQRADVLKAVLQRPDLIVVKDSIESAPLYPSQSSKNESEQHILRTV